jgi:hypothetical protein
MGVVAWEEFAQIASAPVTKTVHGRVRSIDMTPYEQVSYAPPDYWRVEDEHGRLRYLANETGHYLWRPGGRELAWFHPRRPGEWHSGDMTSHSLIHPRDLLGPLDDDFTHPAGPVQEVIFLDRPAWRVLLAPPPHKPEPVWQILDVTSGVTLAYQSPDGAAIAEFTGIETDVELPPEAFAAPPVGNSP